jgi:hypothetical protein
VVTPAPPDLAACAAAQVSISGQALVFVVRTSSWSIIARAGLYTYIAFFGAQVPHFPGPPGQSILLIAWRARRVMQCLFWPSSVSRFSQDSCSCAVSVPDAVCPACCVPQVGSTLIAGFGFAGYTHPRDEWGVSNAKFTQLSNGHGPPFLGGSTVPLAGTEGAYTASVIGCTCAPSPACHCFRGLGVGVRLAFTL